MKITTAIKLVLSLILIAQILLLSTDKANLKRNKLFSSNNNQFENTVSLQTGEEATEKEFTENNETASNESTENNEFDLDGFSVEKPENNEKKPEKKPEIKQEKKKEIKKDDKTKLFSLKKKRQDQEMQQMQQQQQQQQQQQHQETSSQSSSQSSFSSNSSLSFSMNEIKLQQVGKWKGLFKTMDRTQSCSKSEKSKIHKKKSEKDKNVFLHNGLPFSKPSWDEKQFGGQEVGYYFDYIDSCWQKQIVQTFRSIYEEAKKMPDDPVKDPYSLENQLKALASSGLGSKINNQLFYQTGPEIVKFQEDAMVSVKPKFNPSVFNAGISYPQLNKLLKDWNWVPPKMADYADPAKHVLDKYDFDGNGRLDPREFIFYSIKENKQMLADKIIRQHFYTDFINNVLDPFFSYADCDGDGVIDAENIWFSSELLSCRNPTKWDIYKCDAKAGDSSSDFRTSSVNDLVLKNMKQVEGYLNREEFFGGILLGFWDRQVSPRGILEGDELNGKYGRWGGFGPTQGEVDLECQQIKKIQLTSEPVQ